MKVVSMLAVSGALAVLARAAAGAAITMSAGYSGSTDWSQGLSIPQFNPSLGTLTSVTVELSGGLNVTLEAENTSPNGTGGITMLETLSWSGTTITGTPIVSNRYVISTPDFPNYQPLGVYDGTFDYAGSSAFSETWSLTAFDTTTTYVDPSVLADFIGTGELSGNFASTANLSVWESGSGGWTASTSTSMEANVTYTYTPPPAPLPEPAGPMTTMLAGGPLCLMRRRALA
jgi:hypothetical protein